MLAALPRPFAVVTIDCQCPGPPHAEDGAKREANCAPRKGGGQLGRSAGAPADLSARWGQSSRLGCRNPLETEGRLRRLPALPPVCADRPRGARAAWRFARRGAGAVRLLRPGTLPGERAAAGSP